MKNKIRNEIPAAVKELRLALGLSQQKMADHLKMGLSTIKRWELGEFSPTPDALASLYFLAREANRPDLYSIFIRSGRPTIDAQAGGLVLSVLPSLDQFFGSASAKLMEALAGSTLTNEARGALIGEALTILTQGRGLIAMVQSEVLPAA